MGLRLPTADTNFKQKQAILAKFAANIYTLMGNAEGVIAFPTPPVALTDLIVLINNYNTALATAFKGSKEDTSNKNDAKAALIGALRANAIYVTQVSQALTLDGGASTVTISVIKQSILSSGYKLNKTPIPVADRVGISLPKVKHAISKEVGSLYILLTQYTRFKKGTKVWQLRYRTTANGTTPAGPWVNVTFSSGRITATGLTSGKVYDWQVGAIGGWDTRLNNANPINYTPVRRVVII